MPMIVVAGAGKSGTSALFYAIRSGLEDRIAPIPSMFEPKTVAQLDSFTFRDGVIKVMLNRSHEMLRAHPLWERVTHRVFIFRDPRDNIVSNVMHRIATRIKDAPPDARDAVLTALRRKQDNPDAISLVELINLTGTITPEAPGRFTTVHLVKNAYSPAAFLTSDALQRESWMVIAYEDFAAGRLMPLSDYLAFPVNKKAADRISATRRRVGRPGDWVNWFTPEDYGALVAPYAEKMEQLGFDLAPHEGPKQIRREACLGYVERFLPVPA